MDRLPKAEDLRNQCLQKRNENKEDAELVDLILSVSNPGNYLFYGGARKEPMFEITYQNLTERQKEELKKKGYKVDDWGLHNSTISWK